MLLFSDLMEYEPDANMLFNYMMISALANVADRVEREGGKSSGGRIERLSSNSKLYTDAPLAYLGCAMYFD